MIEIEDSDDEETSRAPELDEDDDGPSEDADVEGVEESEDQISPRRRFARKGAAAAASAGQTRSFSRKPAPRTKGPVPHAKGKPVACDCKKMMALMSRLGAVHAAKMHGERAGMPNAETRHWTNNDWLEHFREEEEIVFPIMLYFANMQDAQGRHPYARMAQQVAQLTAEHRLFRMQIAKYGKVDERTLIQHSKDEDAWILPLEKLLDAEEKRMGIAS